MKALVFVAPGRVELREEPSPTAADDEEIVAVRASGICGSELHGFRSVGMRVPPLIMGHEFAGVTASGRRVVVNPLVACGTCDSCAAGRPQVCRNRVLLGANRAGGFAESVAVPRLALYELPNGLPWTSATLIEPLANALHAWSLPRIRPSHIGVLGAGPIGLLCGLVAKQCGGEVDISEPVTRRREMAGTMGLRPMTRLHGEYDAVFDAVGLPATRQASIERVRPGGAAVWLGLAEDTVEVPGNALVRAEKTIHGSFAYTPAEFAEAVELAVSLDLSWTTEYPLEDADTVFHELAEGHGSAIKAVIVPGER